MSSYQHRGKKFKEREKKKKKIIEKKEKGKKNSCCAPVPLFCVISEFSEAVVAVTRHSVSPALIYRSCSTSSSNTCTDYRGMSSGIYKRYQVSDIYQESLSQEGR